MHSLPSQDVELEDHDNRFFISAFGASLQVKPKMLSLMVLLVFLLLLWVEVVLVLQSS